MAKGDKKNIIGRRKPKSPQKENLAGVDGRDMFQTPNYATELLVPYLPWFRYTGVIWECACGDGKITEILESHDWEVYNTDIRKTKATQHVMNFLTDPPPFSRHFTIVTNPPFSLKRKFYERCRELEVPFALLIPADYSGWIIKATQDGAEKIIPTRRIDYITPTGLSGASGHTSYYHSMWLTWGLGLGQSETFVELSLEDKKNI